MSEILLNNQATIHKNSLISSNQDEEQLLNAMPNIISILAESTPTIDAYLKLSSLFDTTSFSSVERQIILLTISRYADCQYCLSVQKLVSKMLNVSDELVSAIINGHPIVNPKLEALRIFTHTIVEKQGQLANWDLTSFYQAGYDKKQVLEIILGISFMTINNYVSHIYDKPSNLVFAKALPTSEYISDAA